MYVYFLRANGKPKRLKIGKAKDPMARLKTLQTGCPFQIVFAGVLKCKDDAHAMRVEKAFHAYFAMHRQQGEWFNCTDEILANMWVVLDKIQQVGSEIKVLTAKEMSELYYGKDSKINHAVAGYFAPKNWKHRISASKRIAT